MGLDGVGELIGNVGESIGTFISEKPLATAVIGGSVVGAGVIGALAVSGSRKKTKKKTKRGVSRDRKFISKEKHERKRKRKTPAKIYKRKGKWLSRTKKVGKKKTSKRVGKIYKTKNGQPYKIMASGKARFIKKTKRRT